MNEKMEILKMLEKGKITAEDAQKLLEALGSENTETIKLPDMYDSIKGKIVRIKVDGKNDDENLDVDIKMPITLLKLGFKMGSVNGVNISDEEINEILEAAIRGETGEIITVNAQNMVKLRIFIE